MDWKLALGAGLLSALSVLGQNAGKGAHDEVVLQLPDRSWGLRVHPLGFEFDQPLTVQNGRAVWAAGDSVEPGLMVEVALEHAPDVTDVVGCVSRFERRLNLDSRSVTGLKRYRLSGRPVIEYDILEHRGVEINQRNLHGYLFHDGACSEMHVSFVGYQGQPHTTLERVLRSIEIVEDAAAIEDATEQMKQP